MVYRLLHVIDRWILNLILIVKWLSGFYISLFSGWVVFTCQCLVGEWFLHVTVLWLNGFCMPLYSGWVVFTCHCLAGESQFLQVTVLRLNGFCMPLCIG